MYDSYDSAPEFHAESWPKARKIHKCGECGREILPGEKYQRVFGKWEGSTDHHKTCEHCHAGQRLLARECDGWIYGHIGEDLHEHTHEILPWSGLAKVIVMGMERCWKRKDGTMMRIVKVRSAWQESARKAIYVPKFIPDLEGPLMDFPLTSKGAARWCIECMYDQHPEWRRGN